MAAITNGELLTPRMSCLCREDVLVQAWKKTSQYIRYHNWYSDTLELDWTTVNLPAFLSNLRRSLESVEKWENDRIRIVPAPKSQPWTVSDADGWIPSVARTQVPLRPLAHLSLKDQVAATAVMLCLADRVETEQGNPVNAPIEGYKQRAKVVSYGNRLFCDVHGRTLRHRWGSTTLYRAYFQDYRAFLQRPEAVADEVLGRQDSESPLLSSRRVVIIHTDISKFYDCVRPLLMRSALERLVRPNDEKGFFDFASHLLNWQWDALDRDEVDNYKRAAQLDDFDHVILPQGLVAAGFFANLVLQAFDKRVVEYFGEDIANGVRLEDLCRYVDDIRVVVSTADINTPKEEICAGVLRWLTESLSKAASGLEFASQKTKAIDVYEGRRQIVHVRRTMDRIQTHVSGGFDAIHGERILDALHSLIETHVPGTVVTNDRNWRFDPIPDVVDDTVARFGAARFRMTYRSIRPLLDSESSSKPRTTAIVATQQEADDKARAFALQLIGVWIRNPANVRILRIALDIWPHPEVLTEILSLIRPLTENGTRGAWRRVGWYCLAEILRAGATETGFVPDNECLHGNVDLAEYRSVLGREAARVLTSRARLPWFLKQQAALFLLASGTGKDEPAMLRQKSLRRYDLMNKYLHRLPCMWTAADLATAAVLARRSYGAKKDASDLLVATMAGEGSKQRRNQLREIGLRDPSFLLEVAEHPRIDTDDVDEWLLYDLCAYASEHAKTDASAARYKSLATWVLEGGPTNPLRNELTALRFTERFLEVYAANDATWDVITPNDVFIRMESGDLKESAHVGDLRIQPNRVSLSGRWSIYQPPTWCSSEQQWRLQLGYLLRFVLTSRPDYTRAVTSNQWKEEHPVYRRPESHWYQRQYGMFHGQSGFGHDWLPMSDWMEGFLIELLRWPGCRPTDPERYIGDGPTRTRQIVKNRVKMLESLQGAGTGLLMLPMKHARAQGTKKIQGCVVQTVIPNAKHFSSDDPELVRDAVTRKNHRNHLATALMAVKASMALRASHQEDQEHRGTLDWLILPELSVHPQDIVTHLFPFARAHKTTIFAGLTYQEVLSGLPPVNSALWLMPETSSTHGLRFRWRRQGKEHLTPEEKRLRVAGFRPCQWLIEYPWDCGSHQLRLTGSICYDATDLALAADLRGKSDVLLIPALNRDVRTFDVMAQALHYHMFQLVVVANNGRYGGSNAYWPKEGGDHLRQVFHMHGQPQSTIAFFEIDCSFAERGAHDGSLKKVRSTRHEEGWKHPPAGWSV